MSRMPHNNKMSGAGALKTSNMWKWIGNEEEEDTSQMARQGSLMELARLQNLSGGEARGGCGKCGALGHMTYQCRNDYKLIGENESEESDSDSSSSSSESNDSDSESSVDNSKRQISSEGIGEGGKKKEGHTFDKEGKETKKTLEKSERHRERKQQKKEKKQQKKEKKQQKKAMKKEEKKRKKEGKKKEKRKSPVKADRSSSAGQKHKKL